MSPQPSRPMPPSPRTASHLLAIALLALALIVFVSVLTIWVGLRFLARGVSVKVDDSGPGAKQVSIKTPVGSLAVAQDVNEARLGLPIYPGAKRVKGDGTAQLDLDFADEANLQVTAAKFETPDDLLTVRAFYRERLGKDVTQLIEKDREGKTVFEIKRSGQQKIVALRASGRGTEIQLVRVIHGASETH